MFNCRIKYRQNNPDFVSKKDNEIFDVIKILKERQKRTVERKLKEGETLYFSEKRGIVNKQTDEVLFDLRQIYGEFDKEDELKEEGKEDELNEEGVDDEDLDEEDEVEEEEKASD
jgi:hypothetical protein